MSPERGRGQIDFEEIVSIAKELMLRDGHHVPILIVEDNRKLIAGQIQDMPATHGERVELMRFLGQAAAKSGRVERLNQVYMVSEGWMSKANEGNLPQVRPSQDPNRTEVLIISCMDVKHRRKEIKLYEILRDTNQQVIGFEECLPDQDKKDETIEIPLLEAFVHGFQMAFRIRYN